MLPTLLTSDTETPAGSHAATLVEAAAAAARGGPHLRISPAASPAKAAVVLGSSPASAPPRNASFSEPQRLSLEDEHCLLLWKVCVFVGGGEVLRCGEDAPDDVALGLAAQEPSQILIGEGGLRSADDRQPGWKVPFGQVPSGELGHLVSASPCIPHCNPW